ncbi:hypothetical protein IW261DRAFT_1574848 [Armillaria novae-zelandiae]|uniref:Uncharacterized protein n=1 Tax=Armillaria novae-zelandiae TaxID=153914 RepID=A0AA39NHL1_9AGAR|nr:hypothetical protein IW261DRAFT_1574848 [Armillaria novae-zelandiae]
MPPTIDVVAAISPIIYPCPVLTSSSLHPSTPTPTNADTSNSNLLPTSHPELFFPPSGAAGKMVEMMSIIYRDKRILFTDVDGELTPVQMVNDNLQKRHHEAVEGDEARVDDDGGEDHERRMSKRTRKPPASHVAITVGWLPSAVQYLSDPNLSSEWLDLLGAWQVLEG